MADLTVYAEALISVVARAFYDDDVVCLIDVLLREKFLRDDDMSPRLQLPARKLRATLQFLQEEHLVSSETVDDLAQGGSQTTKFYYLDYCRAVHSIRLRVFLLRQQLEQAELRARSSSFYLCPGYNLKRCNGRYTEEEAQQVLDHTSGLFLCQECSNNYQNDPNKPPLSTYTLKLVDNTKDLRLAMDNLRRINVQFSAKFIGSHQLHPGIYDLLHKVRGGKGKQPITSNLPSENFALGIGSKRLAGTGRTAGIKAKKLEQQGVAESAAQAKKYLVGGAGHRQEDLLFLKNALGHEVQFTVEKGGGARANLLASKRRRRRKLMDAAASRIGISLPLHLRVAEEALKRKAADDAKKTEEHVEGRKLMKAGATLEFLNDNIGRGPDEDNGMSVVTQEEHDDEVLVDQEQYEIVLVDDTEELRQLSEEKRMISFQSKYQLEMERQTELLQLQPSPLGSPNRGAGAYSGMMSDDEDVLWEDGEDFCC